MNGNNSLELYDFFCRQKTLEQHVLHTKLMIMMMISFYIKKMASALQSNMSGNNGIESG